MTVDLEDDDAGDVQGRRHWPLVFVLLAIYVYAFVDRVVLALVVEPIRHDLGASDLDISLLLGLAFALCYAVLSIPAGAFVDRYNRRVLIAAASVFWALMTVVCGTAGSLGHLFVGRAGVGVAEAVIMPAAFSLIRDAVPARTRALAFSVFAMAPILGGAISLLGGGMLLRAAAAGAFDGWPVLDGLAPWRSTLVIVGLLGLPVGLLLALVREPLRPTVADPGEWAAGLIGGYRMALRHMAGAASIYGPLILFVSFGAMSTFANSGWLPAMIGRRWGLAPQQVGPVLGLMTLSCGLAGLGTSGFVLDRIARRGGDIRSFGIVAAFGTTIGLAGAGIAPTYVSSLVMAGVGLFFMGTSFSVGATTLGQVTPVRLMGRVTAVYLLFQTLLGQALGPFIVAVTSDRLFVGPAALPHAFALSTFLFGLATIAAALALRRAIARTRTG